MQVQSTVALVQPQVLSTSYSVQAQPHLSVPKPVVKGMPTSNEIETVDEPGEFATIAHEAGMPIAIDTTESSANQCSRAVPEYVHDCL